MAAELALRHPSRVRRLALLAPLGLHVPDVEIPPFFGAVAPRGVGGFGEARALLFADPASTVANEALPDTMDREQQLRWFTGLSGAARLGWQWPHFQSRSLTKHLWRVDAPTLLVFGAVDQLAPLSLLAMELGAGADYFVTRRVTAGVSFHYLFEPADLLSDPLNLGTNPFSFTATARASYLF